MHLFEIVPGDLGKQVVIHLVLEPTAEPVHEGSTGDVACGGDLEFFREGAKYQDGVDGVERDEEIRREGGRGMQPWVPSSAQAKLQGLIYVSSSVKRVIPDPGCFLHFRCS